MPLVGLDTGFFMKLMQGDSQARAVYLRIRSGEAAGVVNLIVIYELLKHGLRGTLPQEKVQVLVDSLPTLYEVVPVEHFSQVDGAARLAHGNGLSMADALILNTALEAGADAMYTTDSDLEIYEGNIDIVNLNKGGG